MDVNLDTFPFGGGLTLADSVACSVPFVTLPDAQVGLNRTPCCLSLMPVTGVHVTYGTRHLFYNLMSSLLRVFYERMLTELVA